MIFSVLGYVKTSNWEGLLIQNSKGFKFYTNGIYIWELTDKRQKRVSEINTIDNLNELLARFKKYFPYTKLIFCN
jgi:hypothetical protein